MIRREAPVAPLCLIGQIAAIPSRHNDISKQQIDGFVRSQKIKRSLSVWRSDHVIVQTTQYLRQIRPDVGIIFYDQNGLGFLSADYGLMHFNNFVLRVSPQPGKVNFDCGALIQLAIDFYVAAGLLDEAVNLTLNRDPYLGPVLSS